MKTATIILLCCVVSAVVTYGLWGFISWDFNPENWGSVARLFVIVWWLFGSYIAMFAAAELTGR